jgi:DNA modification methylase
MIVQGDCVALMAELAPGSVDAIVTDPPYGLEFMGKEWDRLGDNGRLTHSGPKERDGSTVFGRQRVAYNGSENTKCRRCGKWTYDHEGRKCECPTPDVDRARQSRTMQEWHEAWAREALRILKPGGHLLAFGGSRTYHRLACAIEDAGFEIRDCLAWMYGSGFPKSLDVSKAIDKQRKDDPRPVCRFLASHLGEHRIIDVVRALGFAGDGDHGVSAWFREDHVSPRVPTWEQWERLRDLLAFGPDMDAEVCRLNARKGEGSDEWQERPRLDATSPGMRESWTEGRGWNGSDARGGEAVRPEAQQWQGWGTALKPAHEPIVLARKPLAGTVAANVLEHGTGALNVDGCRIETDWVQERGETWLRSGGQAVPDGEWQGPAKKRDGSTVADRVSAAGRWPANVLLDEEAAGMLDEQSGEMRADTSSTRGRGGSVYANGEGFANSLAEVAQPIGYGDTGGASRFFYVAKASSAERNAGLEGFEAQARPNDSAWIPRCEACGGHLQADQRDVTSCCQAGVKWDRPSPSRNVHPTVKPIELMRWLVRLITPPGGVVLDPFTGSGTTGCAAALEGFDFIGFEREAEYVAIAKARIQWWSQHPDGLEIVKSLEAERERQKVRDSGQLGLLS